MCLPVALQRKLQVSAEGAKLTQLILTTFSSGQQTTLPVCVLRGKLYRKRACSPLCFWIHTTFWYASGQNFACQPHCLQPDHEMYLMIQVAIPIAGKTISSNPSGSTVSAFAEAAHQPSSSKATPASAHPAQQQQQITQPNAVSVTLPPAPHPLLPGFVSRPHTHDPIHPLPSEPLARAVSLQCTGPSLGAWAPQQPPLQSAASQSPHASGNEPLQSDLWTDLTAELKSAPISAPTQCSQAPSAAHSKAPEDFIKKAGQKAQQEPVLSGVHTHHAQQGESTVEHITEDAAADHPVTAKPKPKRTRRKLIPADRLVTSPANGLPSTAEQELPQPHMPTRASAALKGRATDRAAATALKAAPEVAHITNAEAEEEEPASRADPSRQAKNAAFKGSGALGLSRRLSSRLLTSQEVGVMAKLPLPPELRRLEEVLFPPVNGMYGFLMRQHIQVSSCAAFRSCC